MWRFRGLIIILVAFIATKSCIAGKISKLKPHGRNVLSRQYSYQVYYETRAYHIGYDNYRTCCKHILGICSSHCHKYRTIRVPHVIERLKVIYKTQYLCQEGWAVRDEATNDECLQAICDPPCVTGSCITPDHCICPKGFTGTWCEHAINYCIKETKPCDQYCTNLYGDYACSCRRGFLKAGIDQHTKTCVDINECEVAEKADIKRNLCQCVHGGRNSTCNATCVNTFGSYRCKCSRGYELVQNRVCTDTDECKGDNPCQQVCWNTEGSHVCDCYAGFVLANDTRSCNDLNECDYSGGGCDQNCTNTRGSYFCTCNKGYTLVNGTRCEDVDECETGTPCDKLHGVCENVLSSYDCKCEKGYELQADSKTCTDINECEGINDCNQDCENTDGSYNCLCRVGWRLQRDGKTCADIDECKEGVSKCSHNCTNTPGSYICTCPAGYYLGTDTFNCIGTPCKTLYKPHHGYFNCTGLFVGGYCYFGCNAGYENQGKSWKKCLATSRWTEGEPRCVPATCEVPRPRGVILVNPCEPEYTSKCIIKCQKGYHMHGKPFVTCDLYEGKTKWFIKATCQEVKICKPNPCAHNGICVALSENSFKCDCSNTGYGGNLCKIGIFTVPDLPQMIMGKETDELYIRAKPLKYLKVKLTTAVNNSVSFYPSDTFELFAPREEIMFKLTPLRTGLIRIRYTLSGMESLTFDQNFGEGIAYAFPSKAVKRLSNIPGERFMKGGCNNIAVDQCVDGTTIKLSSTCKWNPSGTYGYVSVNSGNISVPLSMTGVSFPASEGVRQFSNNGVLTVSKLTQEMLTTGKSHCTSTPCTGTEYTNADNDFFMKRNNFVRSYHNSLNDINPWWITCNLPGDYEGFHVNDIQSLLLNADLMKELANVSCPHIPVDLKGTYSALITRAPVNIDILGRPTVFDSLYPTCVILDLCSKFTYVSLPIDKHLDITPPTSSFKVHINGFGFGDNNFEKKICVPVWNGYFMQDNNFCVEATLWSKVNIRFNAINTDLQFQGELYADPKNLDKVAVERFNLVQKTYMKGSLSGTISIQVHGKRVSLVTTDQKAIVFAQLGGPQEWCMASTLKGVHLSMNSSAISIDYETSALKLYPMIGNTSIQSHIYYDLLEGHVLSIAKRQRLNIRLAIRQALMPTKQIRMLKMSLKSLIPNLESKYKLENDKLTMLTSRFSKKTNKAYRAVSKHTPNYKDLLISINKMKTEGMFLIDSLIAFKDAVLMTEKLPDVISVVKSLAGVIIKQLKGVDNIRITPKVAELLEIKEGLSLSYFGTLCVHSLCFGNNIISIFDVKHDQNCASNWNNKQLSKNIYITAVSKKLRKLGPYFMVHPGAKVEIEMSKTAEDFSITFPATVALFNTTLSTTVRINEKEFEFNLHGVSIGNVSTFNVRATSEFRLTSTWDSIDFFYKGKGSKSSSLDTTLEKMADGIIVDVANRTVNRIDDLHRKRQHSKDLVRQYTSGISSLKKDFDVKKKLYKIAERSYVMALQNLTNERQAFHSAVRVDALRHLKKVLDGTCVMKECGKVCTTMELHDICQELVVGYVHELHCEQGITKSRITIDQAFKGQCQIETPTFHPVYTGTCHKGGQGAIKSTCQTIGTILGGVSGGAGGMMVGHFIGKGIGILLSQFSSCDTTYKAVPGFPIITQQACFKPQSVTQTKQYKNTTCMVVQRKVVKYGEPKTCVVGNSSCILTNDPGCIQTNNNCLQNRSIVRKQVLEGLNVTNKVWQNMELYELRVKVLHPMMLKARNVATEAKRKYGRASAYLKRANLELMLTQLAIDRIDSYLLLEKCFLDVYKESKQGSGFLKFHDIFFKTSTPDAENILLELFVNKMGSPRTLTEFLFVFKDEVTSVKQGLLKILHTNLCSDILYKQLHSIGVDIVDIHSHHLIYPFSGISNKNEVKESEIVCISSKRILTYVQKLTKRLSDTTISALKQEDGIKSSLLNIHRVIQNLKRKSRDPLVREQLKMMEDAWSHHIDELKELTVSNVLLNWNQNMELFTKSCNFTSCFNTKDCIKAAIQNLFELPDMIKVERSVYTTQIENIERLFNKIFSRPENLNALKQLALELQNAIVSLEKTTSFCSRAPEVKLTSPSRVVAFVGDIVELSCIAKSDISVSYNWKHNNKSLLFENQSKLRVFVQNSTRGSYTCETWNRAGRSYSEETFIVLGHKPLFLQQPRDFTFLTTMVTHGKPFFVCNVTSDPFPKISWYYQSFSEPTHVLKLPFTKPVLRIDKPTVARSGFYYCVASNQYGSEKSKKVRLDVLVGELPQQQLSTAFNMPMSRTKVTKMKYQDKMKTDSDLETEQSLGIYMEDAGLEEVKIKVDINDNSDTNAYGMENLDLLRKVSSSRKSLSEGIQRLVSGMVDIHGEHFVSEMERTTFLGFDGKNCGNGRSLHDNGFTCVPCQAGFYEFAGNCLKCPIGTYQPHGGETKCIACGTEEVTAEAGSLTRRECQIPVLKSMDVMIVLDTSKILSSIDFSKVRQFVSNFVQDFISKGKDLRFGIMSFNDRVEYSVRLSRYEYSMSSVMRKINLIKQSRNDIRRTEKAVHLAAGVLDQRGDMSRRRVIVSLLSGNTTSEPGIQGFQILRNESLNLQRLRIHSVAVGIGSHIDKNELLALASMTKEDNIIEFGSGDEMLKDEQKLPAAILKGECTFSGKDVAIAIESSSAVNDTVWSNTMHFVKNLMTAFAKERLMKFGLLSYGTKILSSRFKYFHDVKDIEATLSKLPRVKDSSGVPNTLSFLYNSYITEKYESFYGKKIIILISKIPVKDEVLANVKKIFYYEDVKFLNVVMSLHKQLIGVSDIGVEESKKVVYSLAEATELVHRVRALNSNIGYNCLY